jgi:hypothetical protein
VGKKGEEQRKKAEDKEKERAAIIGNYMLFYSSS